MTQELSERQARRLFANARYLFDIACMAYDRTEGSLDSAPLLQKALHAATTVLLRVRGIMPGDYEQNAREAQRINADSKFLEGDIGARLVELAELAVWEPGADDGPAGRARSERYGEIFRWSPDWMQTVARCVRRRQGSSAPVFESDGWRVPLRAFLVTRVGLMLLVYLGLRFVPVSKPPWSAFPHNALLDGWVRWDAAWYYSVVVRGYDLLQSGNAPNVIFFPLYPVLSSIVSVPLSLFTTDDTAYYLAALAISHLSFLFALAGVHRLTTLLESRDVAHRATWLVALFPFSYIFSAAYPESLFLALCVWTFALAIENRWRWAGALASLAAVTQQPGLILAPALMLLYRRTPAKARPSAASLLAIAAAAPLVLIAYFVRRYGDPVVFIHQYFAGWHGAWGLQHWEGVGRFFAGDPPLSQGLPHMWNLALVPATLVVLVAVYRKYGAAFGVVSTVPFLVAVAVTLGGYGRMIAVTFPLFVWLAWRLRARPAYLVVCGLFGLTQAMFACLFSHWGVTGGP